LPGLWGSFLLGLNSDFAAEDLVDAVSVPVLMISQAVQSMQSVVDVAKEIWKEKKKAEIEAFLLGFLFLIPIGGEVIEAIAGFATIGRIVGLIGDASVLASDLYVVAKDPSAAPFVIFGNILGAGALADGVKVVKAAKARRGMSKDDIGKLGDGMSTVLAKIDKVVAKTCSI
jgi:chitinase